jgi:hypothetical protein
MLATVRLLGVNGPIRLAHILRWPLSLSCATRLREWLALLGQGLERMTATSPAFVEASRSHA